MSHQNYYRSSNSLRSRKPSYSYPKPRNRQPKKDFIHPSKFVKAAIHRPADSYTPANKFTDFKVDSLIINNLLSMNFQNPSSIQDKAIPLAIEGRDVVGLADTGSGKTAAFAIPLLNSLITDSKSKALILAPTRELAEQIEQQCRRIGKGSGLDGALLIGGTPMMGQLKDLKFNPKIIIGTPGRVKDHLERGTLRLEDCNIVVLDEVDRMLDMGFVHDIEHILGKTRADRQGYYFSATLDDKVRRIIETYSENPAYISVKSGDTNENVDQNIVNYAGSASKINKLHDILIQDDTKKVIVFDDTHRSVESISKELVSRGFSADSIHGGKSQSQRQQVLRKFKNSSVTVLVATDVAARGLDVSDITHVINYSLPQTYDDYVHRIGRTGRAGKVGYALTFIEN